MSWKVWVRKKPILDMTIRYFGQIFLAGVLGLVGFPNSVVASPSSFSSSSATENVHLYRNALLGSKSLDGNTCHS